MGAIIRLDNVTLSYRRRVGVFRQELYTVFKNLSMEINRGETVGIIGRNGAGKSSILRLMAGTIEPDAGVIWREPGISSSLLSLQVGFISTLSGRENIILSGVTRGMTRQYIQNKMDDIIQFSGLESFIDQPIMTYSSGMRGRLGFSLACNLDVDLVLIDELLSVGDKEFRLKSKAAIEELMKSNKTVIIVSHNERIVDEWCDRAIVIEGGIGASAEINGEAK